MGEHRHFNLRQEIPQTSTMKVALLVCLLGLVAIASDILKKATRKKGDLQEKKGSCSMKGDLQEKKGSSLDGAKKGTRNLDGGKKGTRNQDGGKKEAMKKEAILFRP